METAIEQVETLWKAEEKRVGKISKVSGTAKYLEKNICEITCTQLAPRRCGGIEETDTYRGGT